MVATLGDEFSWGSDGHRLVPVPPAILQAREEQQKQIAQDLKVDSLDTETCTPAKRAGKIREHIEWILNNRKDPEIKKSAWFLELEYKRNLLIVTEKVLPRLNQEHGESHPEFPMLRDTIDTLRKHVASLV